MSEAPLKPVPFARLRRRVARGAYDASPGTERLPGIVIGGRENHALDLKRALACLTNC